MNGFGVVSEGLLRKAFRKSTFDGAFGPSVAIRMEAHAADLQPLAALFEFGGAVSGADGAKIRKQGARLRALLQYCGDFFAETD